VIPSPVYEALLIRCPREEYVVLQEVTTADGARRADAIAIALWASRGMEMHGFEVKSSRSDWLRELKEPAKAETMFNLCDRWWLLTDSADGEIVRDGELPPTWGWLELRGKCLRAVVKAPKLTPRERPWSFVCRLLRKCHEEAKAVEARITDDVREAALAEAQKEITHEHERDLAEAINRARDAMASLRRAEQAVGIPFNEWQIDKLRAAVAIVRDGGIDGTLDDIRKIRDGLSKLLDTPPAVKAVAS
jgi:hypothetical protein